MFYSKVEVERADLCDFLQDNVEVMKGGVVQDFHIIVITYCHDILV